jgi:hypothetical protein
MEQERFEGFPESSRDLRAERRGQRKIMQEAMGRLREEVQIEGQGDADLVEELGQEERGVDFRRVSLPDSPNLMEEELGPHPLQEDRRREADEVDPLRLILRELQIIKQGHQQMNEELRIAREKSDRELAQVHSRVEGVDRSCAQREHKLKGSIGENRNRIQEVQVGLDKVVAENKKEQERLERQVSTQIQEVRETVEQLEVPNFPTRTYEGYRDRRVPEEMKFAGRSDKPLLFLKDLRSNLGRLTQKWSVVRETLKSYLIGPAHEWYLLVIDQLSSYEEFENRFRQQYWSVTIQSNLRRKIENGRYDSRCNLTPNEYLLSQRLLSTQFTCFDDELQFVLMISRHFSNRIQEAQINGGITTIQRLSDVLEAYHARDEFRVSQGQQGRSNHYTPNLNYIPDSRNYNMCTNQFQGRLSPNHRYNNFPQPHAQGRYQTNPQANHLQTNNYPHNNFQTPHTQGRYQMNPQSHNPQQNNYPHNNFPQNHHPRNNLQQNNFPPNQYQNRNQRNFPQENTLNANNFSNQQQNGKPNWANQPKN